MRHFYLGLAIQTTLACLSTKGPETTDCSTCPSPYNCGAYAPTNCIAETMTLPAPYAMVQKVGTQCQYQITCPGVFRVKIDRGGGFVLNADPRQITLTCAENSGGVWTDITGGVSRVACANI